MKCGHCNNRAPMVRVAEYSQVCSNCDEQSAMQWDAGDIFLLLLCPACGGVILVSFHYHDMMDPPGSEDFKTLYPTRGRFPLGLPKRIMKAYEAAMKVKTIDANAYAVLIGRMLEMVCDDRNAVGKTFYDKLADLAAKKEIPEKLVGVAHGIRGLRNIGAHASEGDLTPAEVPILDDLSKAILEYIYSAPFLAGQAEERLQKLKKGRSGSKA